MADEACCTCATLLAGISPAFDEKSEKPLPGYRRLDCCQRIICWQCITANPRFGQYCPFCQIPITPTPLPQGLRDPPAYSPSHTPPAILTPELSNECPPSYTPDDRFSPPSFTKDASSTASDTAPDVLHFLDPSTDSILSLSLLYNVPALALRRYNNIYSDHLLAARRTLLIPGEYYKGGVSLSPRPVEGEEEEGRKTKIRRLMVACKIPEYDVAVLYLEQSGYRFDKALEAFKEDEKWEREHSIDDLTSWKGKGRAKKSWRKRFGAEGGLTGQLL
ncbi:MAG: hypothetical protein M1834_003771 [Cirrosporium novae-zelandiae]|nr:MAG: hypothetical protein M1834_003771 [Cirrosporium novae-zelandiae]